MDPIPSQHSFNIVLGMFFFRRGYQEIKIDNCLGFPEERYFCIIYLANDHAKSFGWWLLESHYLLSMRQPPNLVRLALLLVFAGAPMALFVIAVVCSSWSAVNAATHQRDLLTPYGDQTLDGVRCGNRMVARRGGQKQSIVFHFARVP